jgi:G3E family GTPase
MISCPGTGQTTRPDLTLTDVAAEAILDTGLFDFDKAHEHPMWAKELYGFADHVPETEEYGVASFVYRARQPFEPEKILAVLNGEMPGVIRANDGRTACARRTNTA